MDQITTVTKLKIRELPFYLIVSWNESVDMELVNNDQIWRGGFYLGEMEPYYAALGMSAGEYLDHTKRLMIGEYSDDEYAFALDDGSFAWKKIVDEYSGMNFVHGQVKLTEYYPSGGSSLVADKLIGIKEAAEAKLDKNRAELANAHKQMEAMKAKLSQMVLDKNKMEEELYGKFVTLLNAKKVKIASLEEYVGKDAAKDDEKQANSGFCNEDIRSVYMQPNVEGTYRMF